MKPGKKKRYFSFYFYIHWNIFIIQKSKNNLSLKSLKN